MKLGNNFIFYPYNVGLSQHRLLSTSTPVHRRLEPDPPPTSAPGDDYLTTEERELVERHAGSIGALLLAKWEALDKRFTHLEATIQGMQSSGIRAGVDAQAGGFLTQKACVLISLASFRLKNFSCEDPTGTGPDDTHPNPGGILQSFQQAGEQQQPHC